MATNYTTNYQLNQWEPADAVQRVDFNADNAKVDTALKSLSAQVIQKADQSAVNTLISAVNQKADQSALNTLVSTVSQKADASTVSSLSSLLNSEISQRQEADSSLQTALTLKGNCQIYYTTYVGDGTGGEDAPCTMTFSHKPMLMAIAEKGGTSAVAVRGAETAYRRATGAAYFKVAWGDKSVSWWHTNGGESQMNQSGVTYHFVALLDVQE